MLRSWIIDLFFQKRRRSEHVQFVPGVSEEEKPWVTDEGRLEMLQSHRFNLSFENIFVSLS